MIEFIVQIRNERYEKKDINFTSKNQKLLANILKKISTNLKFIKNAPIYFSFHDYVDELYPLAIIEPNFNREKISIKYILVQFSPPRWYFTTPEILENILLHEALHFKYQFLEEFKQILLEYQGNLVDAIFDIHLIPYIKKYQFEKYEAERMLIGRVLNLLGKKNRILLVKNFCESNKNKEFRIKFQIEKPSTYLLSPLYYSNRYQELLGKRSEFFDSILNQIKSQDGQFNEKVQKFYSIFKKAISIKNGEEMEKTLLLLNSFKDELLKEEIQYILKFNLNFKKKLNS